MIVKLAFAFGAGFISFLTPCVLPIIPGYISYITGKNLSEIDQNKRIVLIKTILFSLGFSRMSLFINSKFENKQNLIRIKTVIEYFIIIAIVYYIFA